MDTHNEGATVTVDLTFTDEDGGGVTPSAATYRVTDAPGGGTELVAKTAFTPAGSTHTLIIPATVQRILDPTNAYELRAVAVEFTYGSNPTKTGTGEVVYRVKNLHALVS